MTFPCSRCGLCCQNIQCIDALAPFDRGDGTCIHFFEEKGCAIYENRPIVCRVDEGYEVFAEALMTRKQYYKQNARVCNELQEKAGKPIKLRIVL